MAIEQIKETDTLNQGRTKINAILDQSNTSMETIIAFREDITTGISDAKKVADDAGKEAVRIATEAGDKAKTTADQALANSTTAVNTSNQAVGTANQNKQDFDTLRNEFDDLVAQSGDSNPEIVQARTDTQGIKQSTLQARLTKDLGNRMTTSDAIQLFSGPVNTPKMMDFSKKVVGNTATNPNVGFSDFTATTLKKPSAVWQELTQDNYNKLISRDDSGVTTGSTQNGVIPQQIYKFNCIETIKILAPKVFDGLSTGQIVKYIKDHFVSITLSVRGKASSPTNKNLKVGTYLQSTDSYTSQIQESATDYKDFSVEINDSNFIDSDGFLNVIVYSDSSNGVTASSIDIDYIGLLLTVSLNPLDVLEKSGFAKTANLDSHIKNKDNPHEVTKAQIGLSQVTNVAQASKTNFDNHVDNKNNPHGVKASQLPDLINLIHPVGTVMTLVSTIDPNVLYTGTTWKPIAAGRTLVGVDSTDTTLDSSKKTGGSINPLTEHAHDITVTTRRMLAQNGSGTGNTIARSTDLGDAKTGKIEDLKAIQTGNNANHANWQPYMTVYFWERTA